MLVQKFKTLIQTKEINYFVETRRQTFGHKKPIFLSQKGDFRHFILSQPWPSEMCFGKVECVASFFFNCFLAEEVCCTFQSSSN